ncbi:NAD(P)H-binding protein [Nocardiopsis sp. RSe5-2]|uniref:NAD(P)H-binding protein n=1 Tax=Nocardiopsis endophytica TaxID=3018445 RepID=A0ABT4TWM2_9ACTN|nr:NAD(P)H-binding protein [Nocardiopsis endophytica]MDA2809096.1 NAD(P)H-binding protein [Nocardiopsis endophytica]
MATINTVLVTGATGSVGRHVVGRLLARGVTVRALTRDPASAGLPAGAEVLAGDLARPQTVRPALEGADALYLFPVPETAEEVVRAAKEAGVRRIVLLSSLTAGDEVGANATKDHHRAVERAVEAGGPDWTHVRPGEFAGNVLWRWGPAIRAEGVAKAPYARSRRVPVHEDDIAAVAVAALLEDGHAGRAYEITGPQVLTQLEQLEIIGRAAGRELGFVELTHEQAWELMSPHVPADLLVGVLGYMRDSVDADLAVHADTVRRVTGRAARTFAEWAADNAAAFYPASPSARS